MNKGFTIIELLAAIGIMALVIIISIPAYEGISSTIKKQNLNSKISMMTKSTKGFIDKYHKDKVFDEETKTVCFSINYLIEKNVFSPDNETDNSMTDPLNGGNLEGYLEATYDVSNFEVEVEYVKDLITFTNENCDGGRYS